MRRSTLAQWAALSAVAVSFASSRTSLAHHSFAAEFAVDKPVELRGTITKVEWVNPHSWFHLEVKDEAGEATTIWMVEGGSPNALFRRGVSQRTVPPGTELTVEGYQARDGSNTAVGRSFLLPSGERLFLGGSAEGVGTAPAASESVP